MKALLLALLALGGCGYPMKISDFHLPPAHSDVVWIYVDGVLRRCTATAYGPACVQARMVSSELPEPAIEKAEPPPKPKVKKPVEPPPEGPVVE